MRFGYSVRIVQKERTGEPIEVGRVYRQLGHAASFQVVADEGRFVRVRYAKDTKKNLASPNGGWEIARGEFEREWVEVA